MAVCHNAFSSRPSPYPGYPITPLPFSAFYNTSQYLMKPPVLPVIDGPTAEVSPGSSSCERSPRQICHHHQYDKHDGKDSVGAGFSHSVTQAALPALSYVDNNMVTFTFTREELDAALYGYAKKRSPFQGHALSCVRIDGNVRLHSYKKFLFSKII